MQAPRHGRQIGESGLHLATRPFLPQHDGTALILANDVERAARRPYRRRRGQINDAMHDVSPRKKRDIVSAVSGCDFALAN